jgi:ubiquinone/menaquinone biosynthesis C-methylase UbiE
MTAKLVDYYDNTAGAYDQMHSDVSNPEHTTALVDGWPLISNLGISSALDVGCGTGRTLSWLLEHQPGIKLFGIEPSQGLLNIARQNLPGANVTQGSGESLPYDDASIDVVMASAIMHHVDDPRQVIDEMFRVSRKAVLISDHNNYAFGSATAQRVRMALKMAGLLSAFAFVRQGFKRQGYSDGDGWWYPYSLLDNYGQIASLSKNLFIIPTRRPTGSLGNFVFSQSHLAIVAIKH